MSNALGTWVCLYEENDSLWTIAIEDAPRIDAAVSKHLDSGGTVDTLLDLTTVDGFDLRIRASRIGSWFISTPEGRLRALELGKLQDEEREENRQRLGIWSDDE